MPITNADLVRALNVLNTTRTRLNALITNLAGADPDEAQSLQILQEAETLAHRLKRFERINQLDLEEARLAQERADIRT